MLGGEVMNENSILDKKSDINFDDLMKSQKQMQDMNEFLLNTLGALVEFRCLEPGDHVKRVRAFTEILLNSVMEEFPEYELNSRQVELMSHAAAIHDIGKIAIPDAIIKAPRRLSLEEFEIMKNHTTYGCEIIEKFRIDDNELFKYCYDICRWHHEKADGKGYPDGLKGDEIPIYCQAASIADCFDALVSTRVYKGAVECEEAYEMIIRGECGMFSDVIITCFQKAKKEMFAIVEKGTTKEN